MCAELVGDVDGGVLLGVVPLVLHHHQRGLPPTRLATPPRRRRERLHPLEERLRVG